MRGVLSGILAFAAVLFVVSCGGVGGTGTPDKDSIITDSTVNDSTVPDTEQPDEAVDEEQPESDNYVVPDDIGAMVDIPAGEFQMGCNTAVDDQCESDEFPYHTVTLSAYQIGKYEVTVGEYQQCVTNGACNNNGEHHHYGDGSYCNLDVEGKDNHPMNCVTWYGAKSYCEWIGGRLPTEAEWEKAARGTDGRKYPWGNELTVSCDYVVMYDDNVGGKGCGAGGTMPVGSKPNGVSPYGAYDMIGSVWEWTNDWYDEFYYTSSPTNDPTGPKTEPLDGDSRVSRGGSWSLSYVYHLRASYRGYGSPDDGYDSYGFRCAE